MAKDAVYEGAREVRAFAHLARAAKALIEKSEKDQKGSTYTTMGSLILTAFTFEAYLNHLGAEKVEFWDEIESISVKNKYSVMCKLFKITPDYSRRPHQTVKELFKFRNFMAHGKTELKEVVEDINWKDEHKITPPKTEWEEYCTLKNAKRAKEDIDKIIIELNSSAGLDPRVFIEPPSSGSITSKNFNE
ncbi:hypothetical protein MNBD_NITROSPINAE03-655 [hydrothermal vent metagenome]|uniref:RiboL-PSP-HEPN domain-containing protein n=1 Tax=hydrothermal vent metagenome TaxID=652676 RepID=A0A3B1BY30_9ZZZZ